MVESIRQYFGELPDPRCRRGQRYRLDELVIIAILAAICCTDNWQEVAQWPYAKRKRLKTFLELPHGIPWHDTFGRVFGAMRPEAFERCFQGWIGALAKVRPGERIAIGGKTLRRSFDRSSDKAAIHLISAWSSANGIVFGQLAAEAESNEITAIPNLLELLDLRGAVVSIDAMGCQKEIARPIVDNGGITISRSRAIRARCVRRSRGGWITRSPDSCEKPCWITASRSTRAWSIGGSAGLVYGAGGLVCRPGSMGRLA
jgi:hypothetical protein